VSLTAIGPGGTNTLARSSYIVATNLPPVANFSGSPTNGLAPLTVSFTNLSSSATNYSWVFGDGKTGTSANPVNTYTNAGVYSVSLTAIGPGGTNTLTRSNYVAVSAPAKLVVNPANLDFGIILTGAMAQAVFAVSNAGVTALSGTASITPEPFAILDSGSNSVSTLPFDLPGIGLTNILVRFSTPIAGVFSNVVIFASNGGASTNTVTGRVFIPPTIVFPTLNATQLIFSFETVAGKSYAIEYKNFLNDPAWQTLQTVPGDGLLKTVTNSTALTPQRFYRLSVE
jgi:PKD repeat protein